MSYMPPYAIDIDDSDQVIKQYKLGKGGTITAGSTVELKDTSKQEKEFPHSGDFLRVQHIIKNVETNQVRLRGQRMRRTKYLKQLFDWKLNELAMVLHVRANDQRCPMIAGMEDVHIDQVLHLRDCILTSNPYPICSLKDSDPYAFPASLTKKEIKYQIFCRGRLVCRSMYILIFKDKKAKACSGIVRHIYDKEADVPASRTQKDEHVKIGTLTTPTKHKQYTFADCFCGCGGASQGAVQAGLHVIWGLDFDEDALDAYQKNHTGALPFHCNAHNFPPQGYNIKDLRVDIVHLSPPCCYFSPAHTHDGLNDQANLEAIYTVGPILKKLEPRVVTLEQTFGLYTHDQHKANFHMLLYDMGVAGYDVRYTIQNIAEFGLVQPRKRLLMIGAKRGTPLPPFPKPTHGPVKSGLKPWTFISDALIPMSRDTYHDDAYHQPSPAKTPQSPYSPHTFLKGCITAKGASIHHYSGTRKYTPRELALFQSFPHTYQFSGTKTAATKQIGNAFPPIMAEAMYRTIIKTLAAFDAGLIGPEHHHFDNPCAEQQHEVIDLSSDDEVIDLSSDDEVIDLSSDDEDAYEYNSDTIMA
ncbi:hypothetical protein ACEQ8H_006105 [Pleosporales sp. CAS-2024a]